MLCSPQASFSYTPEILHREALGLLCSSVHTRPWPLHPLRCFPTHRGASYPQRCFPLSPAAKGWVSFNLLCSSGAKRYSCTRAPLPCRGPPRHCRWLRGMGALPLMTRPSTKTSTPATSACAATGSHRPSCTSTSLHPSRPSIAAALLTISDPISDPTRGEHHMDSLQPPSCSLRLHTCTTCPGLSPHL